MKTTFFLILLAAAGSLSLATAGDWGSYDKQPIPDKEPIGCPDYNGYVSAGYHSDYIFRGLHLADETWTAAAAYTIPTNIVDVTFGLEHINALSDAPSPFIGTTRWGEFERTNLFVTLGKEINGFGFDFTYTHRNNHGLHNPNAVNPGQFTAINSSDEYDTDELSLAISHALAGGTITYEAIYDMGASVNFVQEGWIQNLSWNRNFPINDKVSLDFTAGICYYDQQYDSTFVSGSTDVNGLRGFSHYHLTLAAPVQVNCRFSITPYITYIDTNEGGPTHRGHQYVNGGNVRGSFDNNGNAGFFPGLERNSPDDKFFGGVVATLEF